MGKKSPLVLSGAQLQQLQSTDYADIGIPFLAFRNRVLNGDFNIWQRGTSLVTITSSGTHYPDQWVYLFDGSAASISSQRVAFTTGQTAVPDNPLYYVENSVSVGATGQTFLQMCQNIEGVGTFQGQSVTVSFWAKADTGTRTLGVSLQQVFGTGGSPSSSVSTSGTTFTLTTSWAKYSYTFSVPSISGKTLGTNGNDYLQLILSHPVNSGFTIDIAHVQFEQGSNATQFESRPTDFELSLCQRYFAPAGFGMPGAIVSSSAINGMAILPRPMRATPSLVLSTSSPQVTVPGVNTFTASSPTGGWSGTSPVYSPSTYGMAGLMFIAGFSFGSGNTGKICFVIGDVFFASAEL